MMQAEITDAGIGVMDESQQDTLIKKSSTKRSARATQKKTLNVLSLFSGCGGMDLGFEGGFSVLEESINENLTSHFIDKNLSNGFVQLKKTKFKTVFANDILKDARNAWINYFSKRGRS